MSPVKASSFVTSREVITVPRTPDERAPWEEKRNLGVSTVAIERAAAFTSSMVLTRKPTRNVVLEGAIPNLSLLISFVGSKSKSVT